MANDECPMKRAKLDLDENDSIDQDMLQDQLREFDILDEVLGDGSDTEGKHICFILFI